MGASELSRRLRALRGRSLDGERTSARLARPDGAERLGELGFRLDQRLGIWARTVSWKPSEQRVTAGCVTPGRLGRLGAAIDRAREGEVEFFDLETTGLSRGPGSLPFLYGWAAIRGGTVEVEQWLVPDPGEEAPVVAAALERVGRARLLVSYNGTGFDVPLLRSRSLMCGVPRPWPGTPHLDLLLLVRQLLRHRLGRCSLSRAEQLILGEPRASDDAPGSEAPERYQRFLATGAAHLLEPVVRHNERDLLALLRLLDAIERHVSLEQPDPSDSYGLGRFSEARGEMKRADLLYLRASAGAQAPLDHAAALRRARLLRRQGDEVGAAAAWREIWERWRDPEAAEAVCVELEHRLGDLSGALQLAQEALPEAPLGWDRRFARRIWRLQDRLHLAQAPRRLAAGDPARPWDTWLPGGASYEAWLTLRRGRNLADSEGAALSAGAQRSY